MHAKAQNIFPTRMTCNWTWYENGLTEIAVRRKFAALDDAYTVFHAPICRYTVLSLYYDSISEWCLFQTNALEGNTLTRNENATQRIWNCEYKTKFDFKNHYAF